jgi:hypothetical protein
MFVHAAYVRLRDDLTSTEREWLAAGPREPRGIETVRIRDADGENAAAAR